MRPIKGSIPVLDARKNIEGKYEYIKIGQTPYFTDNPREACWLANKNGGIVINNHSNDERECYEHDGIWSVHCRSKR